MRKGNYTKFSEQKRRNAKAIKRAAISGVRKRSKSKIISVIIGAIITIGIIFFVGDNWNEVYNAFGFSKNTPFASAEGVSVHFIDVGQGDSALIITPDNYVLIDSGERDYSNTVINYLKTQGVINLDYIIATHPHSDHIGGMGSIIKAFGADRIIMPRVTDDLVPTTSAFESMLDAIHDNDVEVIWSKPNMTFNLGGGVKMEIIAPVRDYDNLNDYSVTARIVTGAGNFLFTGDIEQDAESDIVDSITASGADISADVLKVAHHGSRTSSSVKFLNSVNGRYAVICVGSPNSYGHPHAAAQKRLLDRGFEILRTDLRGNIVFDCTSAGLEIHVQKGERQAA